MESDQLLIGATVEIDLPEFGIRHLLARTDTGAASCALHAQHIHIIDEPGHKLLEVVLFDPDHDRYDGKVWSFTHFTTRNVKNSFGRKKERPFIRTTIVVEGREFKINLGFIDRSHLTYDMLLGRNLLEQGFLVDVTL